MLEEASKLYKERTALVRRRDKIMFAGLNEFAQQIEEGIDEVAPGQEQVVDEVEVLGIGKEESDDQERRLQGPLSYIAETGAQRETKGEALHSLRQLAVGPSVEQGTFAVVAEDAEMGEEEEESRQMPPLTNCFDESISDQ